jgi:hypothetical protein
MKKYIILLLTSIITTSFAQNTGYMGRHFIINAEASFSPAFVKPTFNKKTINDRFDYFAFNFFFTPSIEAIVWKKGTVGIGYNFFTSYYETEYETNQIIISLEEDPFFKSYFLYQIKSNGCHLFYKQYLGKTYAPLGHYLKFTVDMFYNQYLFKDNLTDSMISLGYDEDIRFSQIPQKDILFGLKLEYGYDFLFFDRLKFSTGFSLGTTLGGYEACLRDDRFNKPPDIEGYEQIAYGKTRLLNAYWFGIRIGIGLLTI